MTEENANVVSFAKGALIFREGDPGGDLLIIKAGVAEVFREADGKTLVLAVLGAGEMLGVMTVTNGGKRTASVRAKTEVTAVEVKKHQVAKMIAEIPRWATAMINDLVLRVQQADDLFVQASAGSGSRGTGPRGPMLALAVQIAEGFLPLAQILAEGKENASVNINEILEKLAKILDRPVEDLHKIMEVFDAAGVMTWKASKSGESQCTADELAHLAFFASFVKNAEQEHRLEDTVSVLTTHERKVLNAIVGISTTKNFDHKGTASLPFEELETALAGIIKGKFETHTLKEAEHFGLLAIEKSADSHAVVFVPEKLKLGLAAIEAIRKLDEAEDPKYRMSQRRTLVY